MSGDKIPKFFHAEIRHLIGFALEDAWQEVSKQSLDDPARVREKLTEAIVALAAIGETDPNRLKKFAVHAAHTGFRGKSAQRRSLRRMAA